jgi:hypothetical protein
MFPQALFISPWAMMMATWWPKHVVVVINSIPCYNKTFNCCVHDGLHIHPCTLFPQISTNVVTDANVFEISNWKFSRTCLLPSWQRMSSHQTSVLLFITESLPKLCKLQISQSAFREDPILIMPKCHLLSIQMWSIWLDSIHYESSKCIYEVPMGTLCSW